MKQRTRSELLFGSTRGRVLDRLRRADESIATLAAALGVTDNAVRGHVAALERDGFVMPAGLVRDTGGKPARLYRITPEGDALFPRAYALVLSELLRLLEARDGEGGVAELLRAVGRRAALGSGRVGADPEARVQAAAGVLRQLGGDVEVERNASGWLLRGYACPLAEVVTVNPQVCALAQALVEELTQHPVTECCDRGERPRCAFRVSDAPVGSA